MKPRITLCNGTWFCVTPGGDRGGFGSTPAIAYERWEFQARRSCR